MARFYAPTTIFIDEVDSIGGKRGDGEHEASRRVKAELLVQMDGVNSSSSASSNEEGDEEKSKMVMVLGATNHPWDLDDALRRRFEKRVCKLIHLSIDIPLPNEKGREEMFRINLKTVPVRENINWPEIIKLSDGYSGADIANVCREAALMQMRRRLLNNTNGDLFALVNNPEFKNELEAPISEEDITTAMKNIGKSVSKLDLEKYVKWSKEFQSC
jgi:katanin p60 ATPase-containing subunit A1